MGDLVVVEELQAFLIARGVGGLPSDDPSTAHPSIWTMPRDGAAMPRTTDDEWLETQTVTLNDPNLSGPGLLDAWLEESFVDIIVRSQNPSEGKLLLRSIVGLIHPIGALGGKKQWEMNDLLVQESRIWRREQELPRVENGLTYDRKASFRFICARSVLAA